jgi:hypothetical protein
MKQRVLRGLEMHPEYDAAALQPALLHPLGIELMRQLKPTVAGMHGVEHRSVGVQEPGEHGPHERRRALGRSKHADPRRALPTPPRRVRVAYLAPLVSEL